MKIFVFAVATACASALVGQAQAGESVMDFWRHEYQRQANREPAPTEQPDYTQHYGGWQPFGAWRSRRAVGYADPDESNSERARTRQGPKVHVDNPDFYSYTPDRLQSVTFDKLCDPQIARTDSAPSAPTETTGSAPNDAQPASGQNDAQPTPTPPSAFTQACTASPAVILRVLPEVGKAISAYYAGHPQFIWSTDEKVSAKALAAIAELAASDRVGLDPADYRVALPEAAAADEPDRQKALLRFDLELSAKALTYVLDATRGRVDPNRISGYHDLPRKQVDLAAALDQLAHSDNVAAYLKSRNPDSAQFRALVTELGRLGGQKRDPLLPIAEHTYIRPGQSDPQLAAVIADIARIASADLKQKFAAVLANSAEPQLYTPERVKLVRAFQKEKGMSGDGVIGKSTIRALTGGNEKSAGKVEKVKLALERLRWLPREFGNTYVFLNEPAFEVSYIAPGKAPLTMRAVVGRPNAQTYFFTDHIKDVQYNPYWNVPRSIVINEMLPKLYRDPSYLNDRGYEVSNQRGREIASNSVNWAAFAHDKVSVEVRQPPGRRNALGQVKIEFPNKHAIYMHDTPEKHLFAHASRAFSHGCVRLQHPREMAAALLGKSTPYVDKRIASGDTESERVTRDIPVYLAYFTAWPDADGDVHYYDDVYSRDAHLQTALAKTETARQAQ